MRDPSAFRKRYEQWKSTGELPYKNGRPVTFDDGTEPYVEYVDNVRVNPLTGGAILSNGNEGSVILPEVTVRPLPKLTRSAFNGYTQYLDDLAGFVPVAGDVNDAINAGIALKNKDYSQAALLSAGLFLPNALEKPLKFATKAARNLNLEKRMYDAVSKLDFTKKWDDDTYTRWLLNGENVPDFKYVFHGRKTHRGNPSETLRTYSDRDVGLHLSENKGTAERFSKTVYPVNNGVVYQGVDYGVYPDAIYSDLGIWDAQTWKYSLDKSKDITPELEEEALRTFNPALIDKDYGRYKTVRDIIKNNNIDEDKLAQLEKTSFFARDGYSRLEANKEFADYLRQHHVNFKYKNDFEGGGFKSPSIFVTDPSDIHWIPEIKMIEKLKQLVPVLDWKTGTIEPGLETFPQYIERLSYYKHGKDPIHINPANRGKFNALKKRTGKTTELLTHSKNALTRKRAIFALNARKWNHKRK